MMLPNLNQKLSKPNPNSNSMQLGTHHIIPTPPKSFQLDNLGSSNFTHKCKIIQGAMVGQTQSLGQSTPSFNRF